ncbi:MAG: Tim44/TimA family putative adaptor protein [Paracoccaceae bacterium]|nr:Tim44/TimA family putative adaptor protein [Paracoccaceae bacterium]
MGSSMIQLLVLAGIAVFLILRLKNVLGTREGFEKPRAPQGQAQQSNRPQLEVVENGPDQDIAEYVEIDSEAGMALAEIKAQDRNFTVQEFLGGAKGAYEMILMAFEGGKLSDVEPFLSEEVMESFVEVVADREDQGLTVTANFIGLREMAVNDATLDPITNIAEVTVKFVGEMTSVVHNAEGEVVEGDEKTIKRQKDTWTFARDLGDDNPNWQLVATGG